MRHPRCSCSDALHPGHACAALGTAPRVGLGGLVNDPFPQPRLTRAERIAEQQRAYRDSL